MHNHATATSSTRATAFHPSDPYYISDWERNNYYHGICPEPVELLYRSDLLSNPFPKPTDEHFQLPTKSVYGVFNTPLNTEGCEILLQINGLLKARKIRSAYIGKVRFCSRIGTQRTYGPIVIWIAVRPDTIAAKDAYEASPEILALLEAHGVEGAVVEWIEGVGVML